MRFFLLIGCCLSSTSALADVVNVPSSRDNTMYESVTGSLSNGAGPGMHAGMNGTSEKRRALIRFDIAAAVPAGSTITGVTLKLTCSQSISANIPVALHRATADWGEGTSIGGGIGGGQGGAATAGDATWLHRFYPGDLWTTPGGDYAASASGSTQVSSPGPYTWSTDAMAGDVQAWLDTPASNFGWVIIGDESTFSTAKRFDTREVSNPSTRPVLTVEFDAPCYPDCNEDGLLTVADFGCFQTKFVLGDPYADCNGDGLRTVADFGCFQTKFVQGCP